MRKRLKPEQVKQLKEIRGSEFKQNKKNRYNLKDHEYIKLFSVNRKMVTVKEKYNAKGEITSYTNSFQQPKPIDIPESHEIIRISTNKTTGQQWVITKPKHEQNIESEIDYSFIETLVKKHIKPILESVENKLTDTFDRLIYTDAHIGMHPNKSGHSLFGGEWNANQLDKRLDKIVSDVVKHQTGSLLIIDELGDFVDGWNGQTVRKGHELPQNMDNQEMFDVGVSFKIKLIDRLVNYYSKIECNNICEDNHAGAFGYVVNSAFKSIIEQKYENVKVTNHRKFINHYFVNKHCFVISHGKDSHALKFGFKPQLDPKQIEKIDGYLKQNGIYKVAEYIEFSKGDSHQMLFDYCTSDDFDYFNYPALSPSSEWVQTNFKKGRSGFVIQNINYDSNDKVVIPKFFM